MNDSPQTNPASGWLPAPPPRSTVTFVGEGIESLAVNGPAVGTVWQDSNGHRFTVTEDRPVYADRAGDTRLRGISSHCDQPPVCNRDHDGPYEVTADRADIDSGYIFGWTRITPPAPSLPDEDDL